MHPKTFRVLTCVFAFVSLIPTRHSASRQNFYCLPCVRLYLIQRNVSARGVAIVFFFLCWRFFFCGAAPCVCACRLRFARRCVRFARCCVRGSTLGARLDAVCAARHCARSALCARIGACVRGSHFVCGSRCVCNSRFAQYFFASHSETRMYFFAVQIAAYCCWLVAVSAQVTINAADAKALNQTLTGLGCWQSSLCKTVDFSCNSAGVVRCYANGSVTYL